MFPRQGLRVRSLVRELRAYVPPGVAKNLNTKKYKFPHKPPNSPRPLGSVDLTPAGLPLPQWEPVGRREMNTSGAMRTKRAKGRPV